MKIINQTETSAILAGLRLLQRYGYPKEYETLGELDKEQIDQLCEAIKCDAFANLPVVKEKITVYAVVSDTDDGTRADLYVDKKKAENGYIEMVCSYDQVREELDGNSAPTYAEASDAWSAAISDSTYIIDSISFQEEEFEILVPMVKISAYVEGGICHSIHSSLPISHVNAEVFDADNLHEEGFTTDDIENQQSAFWGEVEKHQVY